MFFAKKKLKKYHYYYYYYYYYYFHEDLESSEQSPALEDQNTQVSQDRPSLASGPQKEPIMTDQEKQRKTGKRASITYPQVILVSGKEIPRETVYFDPSEKKLIICSGMPKDISDKVIVLDMSKAGMGGFFSLAL